MDESAGRGSEALVALALARQGTLVRYLVRSVGSWADGQELFSRLLWRVHRLPAPAAGEEWLAVWGQARKLVHAWHQGRERALARATGAPEELPSAERLAASEPSTAQVVAGRQLLERVRAALARLRPSQRRLLLAAADGRSLRALAGRRRLSRSGVRHRLAAARAALLEQLDADSAGLVRELLGASAPVPPAPRRTWLVERRRTPAGVRRVDG